jgi:hypothetical protein
MSARGRGTGASPESRWENEMSEGYKTYGYGDSYGMANEAQVRAINNVITTLLGDMKQIDELEVDDRWCGIDGTVSVSLVLKISDSVVLPEHVSSDIYDMRTLYIFNVGKRGGVFQYERDRRGDGYHREYRRHPRRLAFENL